MVFWKRRHKLPKFPDGASSLFLSLCEPLEGTEIPHLRQLLETTYTELTKAVRDNPHMNRRRLEDIYRVAVYLLKHYDSFTENQQALIVGAARYFMNEDDGLSDTQFYTGLDDDAKIFNYVLEEIGIEDRFIKLQGSLWK